jgi:hypothetical protein
MLASSPCGALHLEALATRVEVVHVRWQRVPGLDDQDGDLIDDENPEDGEAGDDTDDSEDEINIEIDSLDDAETDTPDESVEKKIEFILKKFKNDPAKMAKAIAELERTLGEQGKQVGDLKKQLETGKTEEKPDQTKEQNTDKKPVTIEPIDEAKFDESFLDSPYKSVEKAVRTIGNELIKEQVLSVLQPLLDMVPALTEVSTSHQNYKAQVEAQKSVERVTNDLKHEFGEEEYNAILPIMLKNINRNPNLVKSEKDIRPLYNVIRKQLVTQDKLQTLMERIKSEKSVSKNGTGKKTNNQSGKRVENLSEQEELDSVFPEKPTRFFNK